MIVVAWKEGSHASYNQAAANCRLVGAQIGYLIKMLHSETGLPFSKVHVVGYSLGGQVAGYAGTYLRKMGHKLGRITGKNRDIDSAITIVLSNRYESYPEFLPLYRYLLASREDEGINPIFVMIV